MSFRSSSFSWKWLTDVPWFAKYSASDIPLFVGLAGDVHGASLAPAVGERACDPYRTDGVHAVRILDDHPLEGVRNDRIRTLERYLRDYMAYPVLDVRWNRLGVHERACVGVVLGPEDLAVVDIVEDRGEADDVLIAPFPPADAPREVMNTHRVVEVVPAAVPLEQPADVI